MAGSAARNTTAGNTMTSYGTPGGAAGMASMMPGPPSNMQPQFEPSKSQINDFFRDRSGNMQGQPSVGAFEPPPMPGGNRSFSYGPDGQMQPGQPRLVANAPQMTDFAPTPLPNPGVSDAARAGGPLPGMQGQYNDAFPNSSNGAPPNVLADPSVASFAGDVMPMAPLAAGKGGTSGQPAMPTPPPSASSPAPAPQYAPMAPQGGFNVNQASAGALQQSLQGTQQAMGYQPNNIAAAQYRPAELGAAGQVAGADLGAYTNPYEDQVVQQSLRDLSGAQEKSLNQMGAQATAANAFGGSRQGIAEAETRKAYGDQATNMVTGLRSSGFQNAQNLAGQDIARQMQVDAANQAARNQAGQFNVGNIMNAQQQNIANQMSGNQARLGAAAQLGGLGQQAFNTGQTIQQNQSQQGLMQQGLQQALIDAARGQYAGYTGAPNAALSAPLAALGVTPTPQSSTSSRQPGLFDYLSLGATAAGASDARLKTDIKPIGAHKGINLYTWNWNDEGKRIADPAQPTIGVMAQELRETHPHLVEAGDDGYLRVNYAGLNSELEAA